MEVALHIEERLREAENAANTGLHRMDAHETLCAERYAGIISTHGRLELGISKVNSLLLRIGLSLLGGMAAILVKLVFFS